jgi:hypothetical protein
MISKSTLNNPNKLLDNGEIGTIYRKAEQLTLFILLASLPLFAFVYLYYNSGNLSWNLPLLPGFVNGLLISQYVIFHKKLKLGFLQDELIEKVKIYCNATKQRYLFLFVVSIVASLGLLFYKNPVYVVIFAVTLVFFSLGKPSPDRMARLMKLKKEDRELVREASRPR